MESLNTELRKLNPSHFYGLVRELEVGDGWKQLMAVVPRNGCENRYRFSSDNISMLERASKIHSKSPAELFLEEWGTMGRKLYRPTLGSILELLKKAELYRPADYIAIKILKGPSVERPIRGPAARICDVAIEKLISKKLHGQTLLNDADQKRNQCYHTVRPEPFQDSLDNPINLPPVCIRNSRADTELVKNRKTMDDQQQIIQPSNVSMPEELRSCDLPLFVEEFNAGKINTKFAEYVVTECYTDSNSGTDSNENSNSSGTDSSSG